MKEILLTWLKTYFYVCLETLPLFGLIFVINPILITLIQPEHPDYQHVFLILWLVCMSICLLTAFPLSFFSDKYRNIVISLFRSLFLVFFVVTIFYPEGGRRLDGVAAENASYSYYLFLYSSYITSVVILTLFFLRNTAILRNIYIAFVFCGFAFASYYLFQHWRTFENTTECYSDKTELSFGSAKNIIVILADMLQGSTIEQYLTMYPQDKNYFQGFTLFSRATSPFPFTLFGAPAIFTGNMYNYGFEADAYQQVIGAQTSSFVTDAEECGFDSTVIGLDTVKLHNNQICYSSSNHFEIASILFALSVQRITKISMRTCGINTDLLLVGYKKTSSDIMNRFAAAPIGKNKSKVFFFHNMIPHAPIVFRHKDLKETPFFLESLELTVENYWGEMGFFLGQVSRLIEHMKRIGIYDQSLIVITGDHGHVIGKDQKLYDYAGAEDFYGCESGGWAHTAAMYNPAILIKPPLQKGPLQISKAASSTLGIRPLIQRYLSNETQELLKVFEISGKNKVAVFKDKVNSDPYKVSNDHVIIEFTGNISELAQQFIKSRAILYTVGTTIEDISDYVDDHWATKENGGAWLSNSPATLRINASGVESKTYKLGMTLSGLINERHPEQRVRVWLNKNKLGEFLITKPGKNRVDLDIPRGLLVNGINVFKFEPLNAISPKEIGAWETLTPLSVFLYSFQLLELEKSPSSP